MMDKEYISELYDAKYKKSKTNFSLSLKHEKVLEILSSYPRESNLADMGCGEGRLLSKINDMGFRAIGFDISREAVNMCRKKGLQAEVFDSEKEKCENNYSNEFDILVSVEVIEHIF